MKMLLSPVHPEEPLSRTSCVWIVKGMEAEKKKRQMVWTDKEKENMLSKCIWLITKVVYGEWNPREAGVLNLQSMKHQSLERRHESSPDLFQMEDLLNSVSGSDDSVETEDENETWEDFTWWTELFLESPSRIRSNDIFNKSTADSGSNMLLIWCLTLSSSRFGFRVKSPKWIARINEMQKL